MPYIHFCSFQESGMRKPKIWLFYARKVCTLTFLIQLYVINPYVLCNTIILVVLCVWYCYNSNRGLSVVENVCIPREVRLTPFLLMRIVK